MAYVMSSSMLVWYAKPLQYLLLLRVIYVQVGVILEENHASSLSNTAILRNTKTSHVVVEGGTTSNHDSLP